VITALLLLTAAVGTSETSPESGVQNNPFYKYLPKEEKLGPGPHTLVISDGSAMNRTEYKSGPLCQKARDVVRLQTDARLTNRNPNVIYGAPRVTAFCIPR
jgi:hypothetical protein